MRVFIESKRKLVSGMDISFFHALKTPLILRYNSVDTPSLLHRMSIVSMEMRWTCDGDAMEMRWRYFGGRAGKKKGKGIVNDNQHIPDSAPKGQ